MKNPTIAFSSILLLLLIITGCRKDIDRQLQHDDLETSMPVSAGAAMPNVNAETDKTKVLKVSVYGGTDLFKNAQWNNWNTTTSLSTGDLRFTDGSSSIINATLNDQSAIAHNGNDYITNMAPKEVTRYASYSRNARTLTLSGLNNSATYDLEIYASRSGVSNNTTRFAVGAKVIDIATDNNKNAKAMFTSLKASAGKIVVSIKQLAQFNYINGFTLVQRGKSDSNLGTTGDYILSAATGGDIYLPNAGRNGWKGGDTIRIMAGRYATITLGNFHGSAAKPIVIINHGGQVKANRIIINNASYFKLAGTGSPAFTYGFNIAGTQNTAVGIGLAHHVEVCNLEVSSLGTGFIFKKNPNKDDPSSFDQNYKLSHYYIHHNYLHDVHGEGMYIGHTAPDGDILRDKLVPLQMDKVEIAYNTLNNIGWDGIQLSNARSGAKIHHNKITNYGYFNKPLQQAGIIMGGNTTGDIYDNVVKKGTGNGIQAFGYGNINIYNNIVEYAGNNGTADGAESVFCNDIITQTQKNTKQRIFFYKNVIKYPMPKGGLRVGAYRNNSLPSSITDNTVHLPNAKPNWQKFYLVTHVAGSNITGNIVIR